MMPDLDIQYVKGADINKSRWDKVIEQAVNSLPYAFSWYLDVMAGRWDALIKGDYEYVMPLPYNMKLLGLKQIYQPLFTQQLGVFSKKEVSESILTNFLSKVPSFFKYTAYSCNEGNPFVKLFDYSMTSRTNMILGLNQSYEVIQSGYRRSLRKRIRQSSSSFGFRVGEISPIDVVALYKQELKYKIGLKNRDYTKAIDLITIAISRSKGEVFSVHDDNNQVLASVFFLKNHRRLIHLLGSATKEGKQQYAMHFLIDAIIKKYSGQDLLFDFEGSEIPSVAEFFRGFGPQEVRYHHLVKDDLPKIIRLLRRLRR